MRSLLRSVTGFAAISQIPSQFEEAKSSSLGSSSSLLSSSALFARHVWNSDEHSAGLIEWNQSFEKKRKHSGAGIDRHHDDEKKKNFAKVSSGDFYYLGWIHLYTAKLWLEDSKIDLVRVEKFFSQHHHDDDEKVALALELQYHRSIPSDKIVQNAMFEMQVCCGGGEFPEKWKKELYRLNIPNVNAQTVLRAELKKNGSLHLFDGSTLLGMSEDVEFSKLFLSIWLSDKSRNTTLRNQLLQRQ